MTITWTSVRASLMRHTGWILGAASIVLIAGAVIRIGNLQASVAMLRSARPGWLVAAVALQATTYVCVATGWKIALSAAGAPQPLRRLYPIAIGKLFADQVVPVAGMGGNMFVIDRLTGLGIARGAAVEFTILAFRWIGTTPAVPPTRRSPTLTASDGSYADRPSRLCIFRCCPTRPASVDRS